MRPVPRAWRFAGCVLDERSLELKVGGQVVDLDRKPLEALLYLLRHAGEVVTKDELAEGVWPGRIISDSNLTKTMAVVRAALGAGAEAAIKTVHGYGYRLVAPVSVETFATESVAPRFDFSTGQSPPLRPDWRLVSRLGSGGHGEVWLGEHAGTAEHRVFKFAEAGAALTALKREVTLNRLLRETLPERDDFLKLLDWNFEEPPFFIESAYAPGGNLAAWAESKGGWGAVTLPQRLELVAQVADAVAAAHSVGVLHKDLKPANVLVFEGQDRPRIRLADFGSGSVLDPAALAALGITGMGFTKTVQVDGTTSGTPLYLAPEVMAGQPFTVQSDLYALGVLLYQLVAGDTRRALAPGWEKDVADPLLCEDIARTAAGDPADRLRDAGMLARHLRALDQRRQERETDRARRAAAERTQRMRVEVRRLRVAAALLLLLAGAATAAGIVAVNARDAARQSAATAEAVTQFLNKDLLAGANPAQGAIRDLSVRQLLDRASQSVGERFAGEPYAEAQVHLTLADAYRELSEPELAYPHAQRAVALLGRLRGATAVETLDARWHLARTLWVLGRQEEYCALTAELRPLYERALSADDPRRLRHHVAESVCDDSVRELEERIAALRDVLAEYEARELGRDPGYGAALRHLAQAEYDRSNFAESEVLNRKLVAHLSATLGPSHFATAQARAFWAGALIYTGRLAEADTVLARAIVDRRRWVGEQEVGTLTLALAILRLEQGRTAEAEQAALTCLVSPLGQAPNAFRLPSLYILSEALLLQGRVAEAQARATEAVQLSARMGTPKRFYEVPLRAIWAEALIGQGKAGEAAAVLAAISAADLAELPPRDPVLARFRRSQALLSPHVSGGDSARATLQESLEIYESRYGAEHWRSRRARQDLARLPAG